jgi:hypothetical protein
VIEQQGILRPHIARTFGGEEGGKLIPCKNRMLVEEMFESQRQTRSSPR